MSSFHNHLNPIIESKQAELSSFYEKLDNLEVCIVGCANNVIISFNSIQIS